MKIYRHVSTQDMAAAAAKAGADIIRETLRNQVSCNIIVATGNSQLEMLAALVKQPGIDWDRVHAFHLDEYIGIPLTHPASFRLYLWKRFVSLLPVPIGSFHYIGGEGDAVETCQRVGDVLKQHPIRVAFVGIGENGHLAFNDPPADFETTDPYLVVNLNEDCRKQQLGEGWFPTLADVPKQAISMSVRQIMASQTIVCTVPDERKAAAVRGSVEGAVDPSVPASILQEHPDTHLYLDASSASKLKDSG